MNPARLVSPSTTVHVRPAVRLAILSLAAALASPLAADEGMWMPQQIPALSAELTRLGFTGDPKSFADLTGFPMGAIVQLPGCTASFVSADGLIVTNHHCAAGGLQYNSTPDRNLLTEGFLAKTREEELWAGPGSRSLVTVSFREVTPAITGGLDAKLTDRARHDAIDRRVKETTAACEKDGLRCRVAAFFGGLRYFEVGQLDILDLRLVYAPASGIGNYGGETDNWQWPRHTGDFSFFRAYVGKDGKPAAYGKDNVPYHPKHHLKVSTAGASPNELVFVAGYPGRTERHLTFSEVKEETEWYMPRFIRRATDQIAILEELGKASKETEIKTAQKKRGLNNSLTNNKGTLEGLLKGGLLAKKEVNERELVAWIAADAQRQKRWGDVLPALNALQADEMKTRERDATLRAIPSASSLFAAADTIHRLSLERAKKDIDREPEFQERNWTRLKDGQERLQKTIDAKADRALLLYVLKEAAALPADQRLAPLDKAIGLSAGQDAAASGKAIDAFLDRLYAGTKLTDKDTRLALFSKTAAELASVNDSFLELAKTLHPLAEEIRNTEKARAGTASRLRPRYMEALLEKGGGLVAPDANSTLRVTFGTVKGVAARDGLLYLPQTTLKGVADKATGTGDFDATKKQLDAIEALRKGKRSPYVDKDLGDVPVNFLSSVDTTGGNSGSATLNQRGELVGLLFDGTYDTVASDYLYDQVKTRSIHVDSRYMLWVMSEVDGAVNLLQEMGLK